MTRYLLDVNVFLALLWPRHTSHAAAQAWFAKDGQKAWATNPLVQLGVLRLLSNPAVTQGSVSVSRAIETVREATSHPQHEFWPLDRAISESLGALSARVRGHRQWTDAVLLAEAASRNGSLVTFDSGLREIAGKEFSSALRVLK